MKCRSCRREFEPDQKAARVKTCTTCLEAIAEEAAQAADARIAAQYDPAHTPPLPFRTLDHPVPRRGAARSAAR